MQQKVEAPGKKKKTEDLSKLVVRTEPVEDVLLEFNVPLRALLDGDYQVVQSAETVIQQDVSSEQQQPPTTKPSKKNVKKRDAPDHQQRIESSKSSKGKAKGCLVHFVPCQNTTRLVV
jgi:hypothetical protein